MSYGVTEPTALGTTLLPDGRRLGWAEWGPEQGVPVLFFSGAAMGRCLGFGGHVVDRLGVRLIAVERPGLGASEPAPLRTLGDWASDVEAFVRARSLATPFVVAFSQGAPFALACAARGVSRAVALVSGQDDFAHVPTAAQLDPELSGLVRAVADTPIDVERMFGATANVDMMWRLVFEASSELDRGVYAAPDFAPVYRRSLEEGFRQGAAGYARDVVLAMGRWPFDVSAIRAPIDLWYGGRDTSKTHSPDFGATLARRLPLARRHFLPEAGGSLLWTHAEAILGALLEPRAHG